LGGRQFGNSEQAPFVYENGSEKDTDGVKRILLAVGLGA